MSEGWSFFSATESLLSWRPSGVLDEAKLTELFDFLVDTESNGSERIPDKYVDLSEIDGIAVDFEELRRAVDRRRRAVEQALQRPVKTAFFVDNPISSGVVRMLHALLESPQIDLRVFTAKGEAFLWLDADPEDL